MGLRGCISFSKSGSQRKIDPGAATAEKAEEEEEDYEEGAEERDASQDGSQVGLGSALHEAARTGNLQALRAAIDAGEDVDALGPVRGP